MVAKKGLIWVVYTKGIQVGKYVSSNYYYLIYKTYIRF